MDRQAFANIIFKDEGKRKLANEIIHPFVREDYAEWMAGQDADYVIQEAAILFETNAYTLFDKNILLVAPEDLRVQRIHKRDEASIDSINERLKAQWSDDKKEALADFIINNDGKHSVLDQVLEIHHQLLN